MPNNKLRPSMGRAVGFRFANSAAILVSLVLAIGLICGGGNLILSKLAHKDTASGGEGPIASGEPEGGTGRLDTPPDNESKRPTSAREDAQVAVDSIAKKGLAAAENMYDSASKTWTQLGIADDANAWIWLHIREGNYEKSKYRSDKGYTSFTNCLQEKDLNPNIVDGALFDYDYARSQSSVRLSAEYPQTTEQYRLEPETLLAAVINSNHDYRSKMIQDLLARGSDPNQQFGKSGTTALMLAASKGDEEVVKLLLEDSNKALKDVHGDTAYEYTQSESIRKLLR